jgi:tRNA threonylcarbamoyl adenosine modification protein (Sua5/YciO/YrdC/YwlC family)
MSQFFQIHPDNPQPRLIKQAVEIINKGGLVVYPTDCAYAIGCHLGDKKALDRIRDIRRLDDKHNFTLVMSDLSELGVYAKVENHLFRLLKANTPGAFTFILEATKEVPKRVIQPKRRTVGIRIPDNNIVRALVKELGQPLLSSTLILPNEVEPLTDPYEIRQALEHSVDLVIDGGYCDTQTTTVIDLSGEIPIIARQGKGDATGFSIL